MCPYGCISVAVGWKDLSSCAADKIYRDLKEGPVDTWGVHLQGRGLPGVPLSLKDLDKEVVLDLAKSFLPAFLQVLYPATRLGAPELLRWGFPAWFGLGSTLSDLSSWEMSLPFSETFWDVLVACPSPGSL